ncbi:MAG: hypothetical protein EOP22_12255 [Hyphomicrobiales bacterium]|nr:MAG: hypothetical protein EOP22_12255 [Hyphomicrobiales bacterium]
MLRRPVSSGSVQRVEDRRLDVRYVGPINGCYTLSERREIVTGDVEVYACRTQSISAAAVSITAPVAGDPGEWLTARFDGIGIVRGTIERHIDDGFVFDIVASDQHRAKLAAKIDWLKKKSVRKQNDQRDFRRFQPRDPRSTLGLQDGRVAKCFVIDMSRSGAAVSCQYVPQVGEQLVLGTLICHVVRRLDVGFAVQFEASQDAEGLEQLVTGFEPVSHPAPEVWPRGPAA